MKYNILTPKSILAFSLLAFVPACDTDEPAVTPSPEPSSQVESKKEGFARLTAGDEKVPLRSKGASAVVDAFTGSIVEVQAYASGWYVLLVDPLEREGMNVWISTKNLPADTDFLPSWLELGNKLKVEGRLHESNHGDEVLVARELRLVDQEDPSGDLPVEIKYSFDFQNSRQGWEAIFADISSVADPGYEFEYTWSGLPANLDNRDKALRLKGWNRSDDIFMAVYKRIDGLIPGQRYDARLSAEIASDGIALQNGVGGSSGSSVHVKMGAIGYKPAVVPHPERDLLTTNFDKANQESSGADMVAVGDMEISSTEIGVWEILYRNNEDRPVTVTANDEGQVWVLVGTDSGYEGLNIAYYTSIDVSLKQKP